MNWTLLGVMVACFMGGIAQPVEAFGAEPWKIYEEGVPLSFPEGEGELTHLIPCGDGFGLVYSDVWVSFFPTNGLRLSWKEQMEGPVDDLLCFQGQLVALSDTVTSFAAPSGEMNWNYPMTGMKRLLVQGQSMLVAGFDPSYDQVMAVSLVNGENRWRSWQVVGTVKSAGDTGGETVEVRGTMGERTELKWLTGRKMGSSTAPPKGGGGLGGGLGSYPVANETPEEEVKVWEEIPGRNGLWKVSRRHLLRMPNQKEGRVLGSQGGFLFVQSGVQVLKMKPGSLKEWVANCKSIIHEQSPGARACKGFFSLKVDSFRDHRMSLAQVIIRETTDHCGRRTSQCEGWSALLPDALEIALAEGNGGDGGLAFELGLLAIQLGVEGEMEKAQKILAVIKSRPGVRWQMVEFGLVAQQARVALDRGWKALKRGKRGEALGLIEELESTPGLQSLLPASIVDAGDSKAALKLAYKDLRDILPETRADGLNQPLCMVKCDLSAKIDSLGSDPGECQRNCVF